MNKNYTVHDIEYRPNNSINGLYYVKDTRFLNYFSYINKENGIINIKKNDLIFSYFQRKFSYLWEGPNDL